MLHPSTARVASLLAVPALTLAALAAVPAPSYAAEDPTPVAAGASWLESQLTDGLIFNEQYGFNDLGLSTDVALGLAAVGGHEGTVTAIRDQVEANIGSYIADPLYDPEATYAGATAKAAVLAATTGADPKQFGETNLIERLESVVSDQPTTLGRIGDVSAYGDYANTIGQAFAARALDEVDSTLTDAATDFLLAQQCAAGFFRLSFAAPDAADQTCDAQVGVTPDTDVTAFAVITLQSQTDDTDIQAAVTKATSWLVSSQLSDGSFGGAGPTSASNSNSTGLAGWALGLEGNTAAAARAAVWVRGVQADDPAPCTTGLTPELGAIGYDGPGHGLGRSEGITVATQDQWRRASAQALPVLRWAPAEGTGDTASVDTTGFRKAGTKVTVGADGLAPGDTLCVSRGGDLTALLDVGPGGRAQTAVTLPQGTGLRTYRLLNTEGDLASYSFSVLDAKRLGLFPKRSTIARGKQESVLVTGLARGESVRLFFRGKQVRSGTAGTDGTFRRSFTVTGPRGKAGIKVLGEFTDRLATKTITVTR